MTPVRTPKARIAATLRKRVRQFYEHVNQREFEKCYRTIDPRLRRTPSAVTLYQYTSSLERFLQWHGGVELCQIGPVRLHLNEPTQLYGDRDFALVDVTWADAAGRRHTFKERWVRDGRGRWYTRGTGFVSPA